MQARIDISRRDAHAAHLGGGLLKSEFGGAGPDGFQILPLHVGEGRERR